MKCIDCQNAEMCLDHNENQSLIGCTSGIPERKKQTNADRIHSMSHEELAEFILNNCDNPMQEVNEDMCDYCEKYEDEKAECNYDRCKKAIVKWLQLEVEE